MFGPKELDIRNTYNPNLQEIQESAERTYGEANSFFRKEELYLKDVERRINAGELTSEKDIYDECHAIASDLAKCCEMYLKALYIFEHNIPGTKIDELWEKLKNSDYKTDQNGRLVYMTMSGVITFAKYDENNNPITDENGKVIYFDKDGNIYNDNNRGAKIKRNGHQLDRLIELLSSESKLLLETRLLSIPMNSTESNSSVSVLDFLLEKGVLYPAYMLSSTEYNGWLEQHKATFEESRYSGQKQYDVNVEFLYHLATQIRAVVQFKMDPQNSQIFTITDEDLAKLPLEMQQFASFHSSLLSDELIKLIANDEEIRNKIVTLFTGKYVLPSWKVSPVVFCNMVKLMDSKEILYVSFLCFMLKNMDPITESKLDNKTVDLVKLIRFLGLNHNSTMEFFVHLKEVFGDTIILNSKNVEKLIRLLRNKMAHCISTYDSINDTMNYSIDTTDINTINNDTLKL